MKNLKNQIKNSSTEDKIGLGVFTGVMTLLLALVITWAESGFVSYYGF